MNLAMINKCLNYIILIVWLSKVCKLYEYVLLSDERVMLLKEICRKIWPKADQHTSWLNIYPGNNQEKIKLKIHSFQSDVLDKYFFACAVSCTLTKLKNAN